MYTTKKLTTEQWYDLAQRHANRDWNADGYLESIKAVCADFEALSTPAAADAREPVATFRRIAEYAENLESAGENATAVRGLLLALNAESSAAP